MNKVRIGVIGVGRGSSMIRFAATHENVEIVAICDKWKEGLDFQRAEYNGRNIAYYTDYDEFLKHDMDAVVLANYANEHAPFAIKALKAGKHVFSEVLPCQTLKEAVELIETVEQTGLIYAYGENYCFMRAPYEMRRLYREGKIGEFEYGEGEYVHNCEPIWHEITYGDREHWRNKMYATFYCTHSIGPLIHITGLRPVSVVGFEGTKIERNLRDGLPAGQFGIEMITLNNGGIIKSIHGGLYQNSIWYTVYGSKGRMEAPRELAGEGLCENLYLQTDEYSGAYKVQTTHYRPTFEEEGGDEYGHGGSDFFPMYFFIRRILGDENADIIDVYEALDMFLPGLFAYKSILAGGIPMRIPDLRLKEERDKWRNDTTCTDPKAGGDMYVPPFSGGMIGIDDSVYDGVREKWEKHLENRKNQMKQG